MDGGCSLPSPHRPGPVPAPPLSIPAEVGAVPVRAPLHRPTLACARSILWDGGLASPRQEGLRGAGAVQAEGWKRQSLLGTGGAWLPGVGGHHSTVTPHPSAGSAMAAGALLPPCSVAESLHTPVAGGSSRSP